MAQAISGHLVSLQPLIPAADSSFYRVFLWYCVQHLHNMPGMNIGYERACGHSLTVVSVPVHYQHSDTLRQRCSYMAHCGSSVCMNATSTGKSPGSNAGILRGIVHVSGRSSSSKGCLITANAVSQWRKHSVFSRREVCHTPVASAILLLLNLPKRISKWKNM